MHKWRGGTDSCRLRDPRLPPVLHGELWASLVYVRLETTTPPIDRELRKPADCLITWGGDRDPV